TRERAADVEAASAYLAHVPHLPQVAPHERRPERLVVRRERRARGGAALERPPRRLGREPPRLDCIVDPLQRWHVDEPDAVTGEQEPRRMEPLRQRDESALRNRLRAPLHT